MKTTKVFFDTEFTGLEKSSELISIGLISDCGKEFYAEVSDYDKSLVEGNQWIKENVIANLKGGDFEMTKEQLKAALTEWFDQFDKIEAWADVNQYDWVMFCDIFGSAFEIPGHIYYIPFDLVGLFREKGIDTDINREEFSGIKKDAEKHNALWDAKVCRACYRKAIISKPKSYFNVQIR